MTASLRQEEDFGIFFFLIWARLTYFFFVSHHHTQRSEWLKITPDLIIQICDGMPAHPSSICISSGFNVIIIAVHFSMHCFTASVILLSVWQLSHRKVASFLIFFYFKVQTRLNMYNINRKYEVNKSKELIKLPFQNICIISISTNVWLFFLSILKHPSKDTLTTPLLPSCWNPSGRIAHKYKCQSGL